jgi:hypothetical protein
MMNDFNFAYFLEEMINYDRMTNSYKIFCLKSIIEFANNDQLSFSFSDLQAQMIVNGWSYAKAGYNFGVSDKIPLVVKSICSRNKDILSHREKLDLIYTFYSDEKNAKSHTLLRYVQYRLLSPFFDNEIKGVPDQRKNKLIEMFSNNSDVCFYCIDSENQKLSLNKDWAIYLKKNYLIVSGWIENKINQFLIFRSI